ncbi:hypothetical protein AT54_01101 [Streptococcus equi subsp. zooepidemicus Sz12is]|uniref:hypothetical protein n=1 Tax=Streptococcus equi TaxID=1336 RepID=UPI0005C3005B|nr:hypothetical protein [Streptococcus equi]KIS05193.1 hypothetical protein AT54_01101 [Streptococcus equi subsp. zooepidemicus Sz12is]HEL0291688.1 hypothetical protein [Streptococcus equi subsp. zooepidemicus]HEL0295746.1 hypothetical protein [Streptococcus equi subsp. zooepidemicus]
MQEKNKQCRIVIRVKKNENWHVIQQTDCLEDGILVVDSILSFMRLSQMRFEIRLDVS